MMQMWPSLNRVGVYESNQKLEKIDGTNFRSRSHTNEVSSRYKSPTPRRSPSPNTPKTFTKTPVSTRAVSTERRRHVTPQSPSRCSTPVHETSVDVELVARKAQGLWPSRLRSINVAFQSDSLSLSTSKKEKPPPQALSDRTLKSSSNLTQKRNVTPPRKSTPERKRTPLKGKNTVDQSENSKPLVDQHRLPNRTNSKILNKNIDICEKPTKSLITPSRKVGASIFTKTPLEKSASCPVKLSSEYDNLQRMSNLVSSSLAVRSQSLPASGPRPASPCKPVGLGSKRPVSAAPSRGISPSRRPSSPLRQPCTSDRVSVLTFVADIKKGRKVIDQIEDAHYLRLLHNRQMQWSFVNARAKYALNSQKLTAENSLSSVWRRTYELRVSVAAKRIEVDQLKLKLNLYSVLNQQMAYLKEWASIESGHNLNLAGAIEHLQSNTLRLPVTEGAIVDTETVKSSLSSAIQVMQAFGTSIQSTISRLERPNYLASELAIVVAQERALLDECEVLMVSAASLKVKEYSLRTHLIQLKHQSKTS
ncbi:AUGMIN subunit 8-like [Rutidosis leptorrhynchoides]|uniref:AUGMIN subunit 8-like n=1 Tax=Rutidosis leptorrhynchoides TaxID=125765 RepID=UPI003A9A0006